MKQRAKQAIADYRRQQKIKQEAKDDAVFEWMKLLFLLGMLAIALSFAGCFQHELDYAYYLREPNSLHVESLHYKQNGIAVKTDRHLVEAAFADVITLKMDRSVQVPDPNTVNSLAEGVAGAVIGGGL